ncbi:cytochrome P450 [Amylostereum chailletii]|nr:cytochrome P450 [Amylostereum chailletii]
MSASTQPSESDTPFFTDGVVLALSIVLGLSVYVFTSSRRKQLAPYPPGPPGRFIIGNALDFDVGRPWIKFTEWKEQYGDVVGLRVPGMNIVALNSQKAINDLLDRRANKYSDRPHFTVGCEILKLEKSMTMMPYGAEWRLCRKVQNTALSQTAVKQYHTMQEDIATLMAKEFIDTPADFFNLARLCAGRIVLSITYGLSVKTVDSEASRMRTWIECLWYVTHADETMRLVGQSITPGAYLADMIPTLKYLPSWVPFQKRAAHAARMVLKMNDMPYAHAKKNIASGMAGPSLTREILAGLSGEEKTPEMDERMKWTMGAMYGAGGETTFATVLVFLMVMALNPEAQKKAQQELDAHIGTDRLPLVSDRGEMPYIEACIKETMRWNPVVPLSIARRTAEDDIYEGYFIPKGTVVMPNSWAMAFAPDAKYPPREFHPERFLDPETHTLDPGAYVFGYGRRICPGRYVAENSVFILLATILSVFDVTSPPASEVGLEVLMRRDECSYPKDFKVTIKPRSKDKEEMVRRRAAQSTV